MNPRRSVPATLQKGVAFRLIQHQVEIQYRHVIAHPSLQIQQRGPLAFVAITVEHAFEQADEQHRQVRGGSRSWRCVREFFFHPLPRLAFSA